MVALGEGQRFGGRMSGGGWRRPEVWGALGGGSGPKGGEGQKVWGADEWRWIFILI